MLDIYVRVCNLLARLKDEEGQGMVEYGLIIALVAIGMVVALTAMRDQVGTVFDNITCELKQATGLTC